MTNKKLERKRLLLFLLFAFGIAWIPSIILNETIDHGPFPFAQLKHFNLIPSMASVHTELANTDAVKKLLKDNPELCEELESKIMETLTDGKS